MHNEATYLEVVSATNFFHYWRRSLKSLSMSVFLCIAVQYPSQWLSLINSWKLLWAILMLDRICAAETWHLSNDDFFFFVHLDLILLSTNCPYTYIHVYLVLTFIDVFFWFYSPSLSLSLSIFTRCRYALCKRGTPRRCTPWSTWTNNSA